MMTWNGLVPCAAAGPTTPILPGSFDAVYVHFGQSTFAKPYLKNVDHINGLDAIGDLAFYRTKDKKSPHNAYTSGDRITASIEKLGYTQSYAPSYKGHYLFARDGRGGIPDRASGESWTQARQRPDIS